MAFAVVNQKFADNGTKKEVDFDALNEYVVETADLVDGAVMPGIVSVICDLGTQEQPDSEVVFTGDEEAELEKSKEGTYFKDGYDPVTKKKARLKCWKNDPVQCVGIAVDFPQVQLNKGQFFGDSDAKELPLRVWMGGQFFMKDPNTGKNQPVLQRLTALRVNEKLDNKWSLNQKNVLHKMAVGQKLVKTGKAFHPSEIDKLLNAALQFSVQIYFKEGTDGQKWYTEKINYVGGLGRGQEAPETDLEPVLIQFGEDNKDSDIAQLPARVLNTIRKASNYPNSKIASQIERVKGPSKQKEDAETPAEEKAPTPKPTKPKAAKPAKVVESNPFDDMDDDIPF